LNILFTFRSFEQFALGLKNRGCPEFTVLNIYFLSFKIFEQLALALKTEVALKIFKPGGAVGPRPPASYAYARQYCHFFMKKTPEFTLKKKTKNNKKTQTYKMFKKSQNQT